MSDTPTRITVGVFFSTMTALAALIFTALAFFYTEIRENRERFESQLDTARERFESQLDAARERFESEIDAARATYHDANIKTMANLSAIKGDFVEWHSHFHVETDKEFKRFADALKRFLQLHGEQFQPRPAD